jgi:hypothetical protein
LLESRLFL